MSKFLIKEGDSKMTDQEYNKKIEAAAREYFLKEMKHMTGEEKEYYLTNPEKSLTLRTFNFAIKFVVKNPPPEFVLRGEFNFLWDVISRVSNAELEHLARSFQNEDGFDLYENLKILRNKYADLKNIDCWYVNKNQVLKQKYPRGAK